jgi:hypothetical protein
VSGQTRNGGNAFCRHGRFLANGSAHPFGGWYQPFEDRGYKKQPAPGVRRFFKSPTSNPQSILTMAQYHGCYRQDYGCYRHGVKDTCVEGYLEGLHLHYQFSTKLPDQMYFDNRAKALSNSCRCTEPGFVPNEYHHLLHVTDYRLFYICTYNVADIVSVLDEHRSLFPDYRVFVFVCVDGILIHTPDKKGVVAPQHLRWIPSILGVARYDSACSEQPPLIKRLLGPTEVLRMSITLPVFGLPMMDMLSRRDYLDVLCEQLYEQLQTHLLALKQEDRPIEYAQLFDNEQLIEESWIILRVSAPVVGMVSEEAFLRSGPSKALRPLHKVPPFGPENEMDAKSHWRDWIGWLWKSTQEDVGPHTQLFEVIGSGECAYLKFTT